MADELSDLGKRQKEALLAAAGSWNAEDHPELFDGSATYVRWLRTLGNARVQQIEQNRETK